MHSPQRIVRGRTSEAFVLGSNPSGLTTGPEPCSGGAAAVLPRVQVTNYFAVAHRSGSPEDLKALIDAAHGLGIQARARLRGSPAPYKSHTHWAPGHDLIQALIHEPKCARGRPPTAPPIAEARATCRPSLRR